MTTMNAARAAVSLVALVTLKNVDWRGTLSALCESLSEEPALESDLTRDAFACVNVEPVTPVTGHTHPTAAAVRSTGTYFARRFASRLGVQLYILGMSKSDQRKDLRGSRAWWWPKDTHIANRADLEFFDDIRYICDCDYYLDMPRLLSKQAKPTLLYTAVPESACETNVDNSTTYFEKDGSLMTLVSGGGAYSHYLWDYGSDSIMVKLYEYGVLLRLVTYAIERKQVARNRQLVLLTPIKIFNGFNAWVASYLLDGKSLARFDPIQRLDDGSLFVRFQVHTESTTMVTTARPGTSLCATIPLEIDAAIAGVARLGTTRLLLPTVASWLPRENRTAAVVLTEYFRAGAKPHVAVVFPVAEGVRAYQYEPRTYDQDAKPKLQSFMSPLVHGAFAPVPNEAGERQCVKGRITDMKQAEPKPSPFRDQCMEEFATLIMQGAHLEPVDVEVVIDKQTTPAQKLSLNKAFLSGATLIAVLKCFIKSEAYPDVKDPRNISTYNDSDKLSMSQFALALSEHMKQFKWYGPGKTPLEIAVRMVEICADASYLNISDFRRMDGTITMVLRGMDRAVCMKAFIHHRLVLNELLNRNAGNKGVMPSGTSFDQGSSHGSGCAATSNFQTTRAAFTAYLAFRHTVKPNGQTYQPQEAFDALGIHFGDDGADADLPISSHAWACKQVGLLVESSIVQRGDPGVNFLARNYSPAIWTGCPNSMCDVKRQLSKFHTTVRLPANVPAEQKLLEKSMSYLATDRNTPVIGELCQRAFVLSTRRTDVSFGIGTWWSKFDASVQFPNENVDGWMDVEFERVFPEFDRDVFNRWLASTTTDTQILAAPLCAEPAPATPTSVEVVVDEVVMPAKEPDVAIVEPDDDEDPMPPLEDWPKDKPKKQAGGKTGENKSPPRQQKKPPSKTKYVKKDELRPHKGRK